MKKSKETKEVEMDGVGVIITGNKGKYTLSLVEHSSETGETKVIKKDNLTASKLKIMLKAEIELRQLLEKSLKEK